MPGSTPFGQTALQDPASSHRKQPWDESTISFRSGQPSSRESTANRYAWASAWGPRNSLSIPTIGHAASQSPHMMHIVNW